MKTITIKRSALIGYSTLVAVGGAVFGVAAFLGAAAWFCVGGGWQVL